MTNAPTVAAILAARDSGALPASLTLDVWRKSVSASMPGIGPVDLDASARGLEWFRTWFPGGLVRGAYCAYRGSRGRPPADRAEYVTETPGGLVTFVHYVPHSHGSFQGEVHNGAPRWTCGGCRRRITVTESRVLGLLPPKEPAKRRPRQLVMF